MQRVAHRKNGTEQNTYPEPKGWAETNVRQCRAMLAFVAEPVKTPPAMQKTHEMLAGSLGWEDSLEEENGNPVQYSRLKNPKDIGAWWVQKVAKSWTWLPRAEREDSPWWTRQCDPRKAIPEQKGKNWIEHTLTEPKTQAS